MTWANKEHGLGRAWWGGVFQDGDDRLDVVEIATPQHGSGVWRSYPEAQIAAVEALLTTFRDRENIDHDLTPAQILELWMRGAAWIEQVYRASWALKDQDPIPADFTDDRYWPAASAATTQP